MAAVALTDIVKSYGATRAIDRVSLEIESGEFLTLLGPSGCGKTTTLRAVAGLVVQDSGRITIGGRDVGRVPTHKRNIGMVFQSHALFPHMTVAENVGFGLRMRGVASAEKAAKVRETLELVRLTGYEGRFPHELSGGQQQRVALARAFVISPSVLLLDEPFGALDRKLREAMQEELRELTRRLRITALFVTHDQDEALILSDRIAVMNGGRIEQIGAPGDVFERPATRFVADFMGFANLLPARVVAAGRLDAGGLPLAAGTDLAAGTGVTVGIRSERIAIGTGAAEGPNQVAGRVESAVYHGTQTTYHVAAAGHRLVVREPSASESGARVAAGTEVVLRWQPGDVRVLAS